ncbi:MAG: hypothetical protein HOM11_09685 [Methylococcales bacterium]|nr:hypothetical protein [Methylococcales bacterium]MBT7442430.1 hypothetical protein [Methylococcales bacterium]
MTLFCIPGGSGADPAGEGFYNCSDVTIADSNNPTPTDDNWKAINYFVTADEIAKANDQVWLRLFNATGTEVVFEKLDITSANQETIVWADALAQTINSQYANTLQIGVKDAFGNIHFDAQNLFANQVWTEQTGFNYELDVKTLNTPTPTPEPQPEPSPESGTWDAAKTYASPCTTVTFNNQTWQNQWWTIGDQPGSESWGPWRLASESANNSCH